MKVDLNLFVVFDAIYCEGNITKAASALHLSQPAVSHALGKLRRHFDDQLFIRQGNEMRPTPVAKNVISDVREALQKLQVCLAQSRQFEPSTSKKVFALALHGSLEATYLPILMQRLHKEAPDIHLISNKRANRTDLEHKLASGSVDLAMDILLPVGENILQTPLQQDEFVVIARKDHPCMQSPLTMDAYLSQSHVLVSSRSTGPGLEDFELARLGFHRKIGLRCQHSFPACRVVLTSDMLLTLPKSSAQMYSEIFDVVISPLPVELPKTDAHLYWHVNVDKDPANKWLRNKIIMASKHL